MLEIFAALVGGFVMHYCKPFIDDGVKAEGWNRLVSHTVGVVSAYPFVELLTMLLCGEFVSSAPRRQVRMVLRAGYFVAFLFYGIGNATAWLWSVLRGEA